MPDVRNVLVYGLKWFVSNQPRIAYSEGADRTSGIGHPWLLPFAGDCSSTPLNLWNWTGCNNPTGAAAWQADTETWANAGTETTSIRAIGADAVIYGLGGPLSVQHMAMVVEPGYDPLTVSHGWSGEPAYVLVSAGDPTRGAYGPPRFFRYSTEAVSAISYPPGYKAPVVPGSPASKVPARFKPVGDPPSLTLGDKNPTNWIVYLRLCLREAGFWPTSWPVGPGGYGKRTRNAVVRWERHRALAPDGECSPRVWLSLGVA